MHHIACSQHTIECGHLTFWPLISAKSIRVNRAFTKGRWSRVWLWTQLFTVADHSRHNKKSSKGHAIIVLLISSSSSPLCRELDLLYRHHACSNLLSCLTTLESLSSLVWPILRQCLMIYKRLLCTWVHTNIISLARSILSQEWLSWMKLEDRFVHLPLLLNGQLIDL